MNQAVGGILREARGDGYYHGVAAGRLATPLMEEGNTVAFTKVDHVGMLVDALEVGHHVFCEGWGLAVDEHRSPWPQGRPGTFEGVTSIEIPIGEMYLEISKPNDPTSAAARFVAEHRAGMYHIALASNDLAADVQMLQDRGARLAADQEQGIAVLLDPATTLGLRIKVVPDQGYYPHPYYRGDGTFTGMAHIGIAARSAEEIRTLFGDMFGLHEDRSSARGELQRDHHVSRPADDPVQLIEFPLGGTVIEISIPTTDDSGTARLVSRRAPLGAVYHHICPFAPDVRRSVEKGLAADLQQIGTIPPLPEHATIAWFHPRTCVGTLIEIWDRAPGAEHAVQWQRLRS